MHLILLLACSKNPPTKVTEVAPPVPMEEPEAEPVPVPEPAPPATPCEFKAYVGEGLGPTVLYDKPNGTSAGDWPVLEPIDGHSAGPILSITDKADDGMWFEVQTVEDFSDEPDSPPRGPASGWVKRDNLRVDLTLSEVSAALMKPYPIHLREEADEEATILRSYLEEPHEARVLDCKGRWLKVEVKVDGEPAESALTGWLGEGDHCGHPATTCG